MDNETPDYLKWVAEAEGYVTKNGELASTTPVYDTNGNLKTSITPQEVTAQMQGEQPQKQVAEQEVTTPTLNKEGSGEDVNEMQTKIGSTGTFGDNTDTKGSAISTPAVNSNVVKLPAQNETQKLNDQYLQYAEENNHKGMIDTLTAMSNNDGVDRTKLIADLTDRRNQKIQAQDDLYSQAYYEAMLAGNNKLASDILDMQKAYRDSVGYSDSLASMRDKELADITIDYDYAYLNGINEIASYIPQVVGAIMDFQYDPTQDTALIRAQNQAISRVKEQSASTGMYYSSQTQYAITRACAELVPIYEQMAKDELKEKLNLLQSTATFLMNLEQTQFNMWRNQIELQFDKKKLERQEILDAWDRVNNMGYVDNEASIILSLPAGTLSNETQQYLQKRQDTIDAEMRKFEQDIALYDYKANLDLQRYAEEQRIKSNYDVRLANVNAQNQLNRDYQNYLYDVSRAQLNQGNGNLPTYEYTVTTDDGNEIKVKGTATKDVNGNLVLPNGVSLGGMNVENIDMYGKDTVEGIDNIIKLNNLGKYDYSSSNGSGTARQVLNRIINSSDVKSSTDNKVSYFVDEMLSNIIDENMKNFGDNPDNTQTALNKIESAIQNFDTAMKSYPEISEEKRKEITNAGYLALVGAITQAGDNFDFYKQADRPSSVVHIDGLAQQIDAKASMANQGDKAKEDAIITIIDNVISNKNYSTELKDMIARNLSDAGLQFAQTVDGYTGLKEAKSWLLLNGYTEPIKSTNGNIPTNKALGNSSQARALNEVRNSITQNVPKVNK